MSPVLVLFAHLGFGLGCVPAEDAIQEEHAADELLVQFAEQMSTGDRLRIVKDLGFDELAYMPRLGVSHLDIRGEGVAVAMRRLKDDPRLSFAEPNYEAHVVGTPNDPYFSDQWNLKRIGMIDAWNTTQGAGAVVAILDTGVDVGGSDGLTNVLEGRDMVYGRSVEDVYGHGTHVAGTVGQRTDNGRGAAGIAHQASILPVKVLGDNGSGWISDIAQGVEWAADNGADVINMSFGSFGRSSTMAAAVQYAHSKGVVLVGAAGNEDTSSLIYPAGYDEVISVGATTPSDRLASFTNWGDDLDIVAPGVDIYQEVEYRGSFYISGWSGTSMASPHVAGVAALLKSLGVDDPVKVRALLHDSAVDLGDDGWDTYFGYGRLDAATAVRLALEDLGEIPDEEEPDEEEPDDEEPDEEGPEDPGEDEPEPPEDEGPDTIEPMITDVQFGTEDGRFWFTWTTDEPSTSDLWFEQWGWYLDWDMVIEHRNERGASPGTEYTVWVSSEDQAGNIAYDGPHEITVR
jgi:subtilisin family serine protease